MQRFLGFANFLQTHVAADTLSRHAVLEKCDFPIESTPRDEIICAENIENEVNLEFDECTPPNLKHACDRCASDEDEIKAQFEAQKPPPTAPVPICGAEQKSALTEPKSPTCEASSQTERKQRGRIEPIEKTVVKKPKKFAKSRYTTQQIIPTPGEIRMSQNLKSFAAQVGTQTILPRTN